MHSLEGAVDRPGSDFTNFDLPSADFRLCQGECAVDGTCLFWAYVEPGLVSKVAIHCASKLPRGGI